jgi:hypothetical protein
VNRKAGAVESGLDRKLDRIVYRLYKDLKALVNEKYHQNEA